MSFELVKEFFKELELWQMVAAGVIVLIIGAIIRFLWGILKRKRQDATSTVIGTVNTGSRSQTQFATGDGITQNIVVDKSIEHGVNITVEKGAHAVINVIDYKDGIAQSTIPKVKTLFEAARADYIKRKFSDAIEKFKHCLDLETDDEKRGALNLQIGNCYYDLRLYLKAAVFYDEGLKQARKANDRQGQASNLVGIANTYMLRPASSSRVRAENVRKAVDYYSQSLQTFVKEEYPVDYAMTQNNLGNAYTYLPAATPEQRAQNVRNAIDCYKAALEIRKKDEYPQSYCFTAANIGMILVGIDDTKACYWLKEAYALRQFLPDQGKRIEDVMNKVCD